MRLADNKKYYYKEFKQFVFLHEPGCWGVGGDVFSELSKPKMCEYKFNLIFQECLFYKL
jgi:hypothetical protein